MVVKLCAHLKRMDIISLTLESGWWKESYHVPIIVRGPGGNFIVGKEIHEGKRTGTKITENYRLQRKGLHRTSLLRYLILKKIQELLLEKKNGGV